MRVEEEVLSILEEVLELKDGPAALPPQTPLLGAVPTLDSMALVAILTTLEDRFGFTIEDDEIDASKFETVGSLTEFVSGKLAAVAAA